MAFDTQLGPAGIGKQAFFSIRSMGVVAGITLAGYYRFVGIGLDKLYFSVDMAGETNGVHLFFYHGRKIGSVGIMAVTTFPLGKGNVGLKCFSSLLGLLMA